MSQHTSNFLKLCGNRKKCYRTGVTLRAVRNSYRSQLVYRVKVAARLSGYFLHLRAVLDNERCAALMIDCESGSILSSNLPAFELFAIDAAGFRFVDLMVDPTAYEPMVQQLQQTGKVSQPILLHNADGQLIDCKVDMTIAPHYSGWMTFRFSANRQLPYPHHSSR